MEIGGLQKLSLVDHPGKLACTIFFAGCCFRCPWCYNSSLVLPEKIAKQFKHSQEGVLEFLEKRKGTLESVVLSGGEPTIHSELPEFCRKVKKLGYLIKLDTNGANPGMLEELVREKLVDYVAMDVKAPRGKYTKLIGTEDQNLQGGNLTFWGENILKNIEKSIEFLKKGLVDYEFRTTVVPGLLSKEDIMEIVKWVSPAKKYFIQEFRAGDLVKPEYKDLKLYPRQYLLEILSSIKPFFEVCELRIAS